MCFMSPFLALYRHFSIITHTHIDTIIVNGCTDFLCVVGNGSHLPFVLGNSVLIISYIYCCTFI